jgi:CubicO group peptidase (beta-lactamase class C family)
MDPIVAADDDLGVGMFWHVSEGSAGRAVTWHTGQTGGYTTYFGIDRADRTAVVVLSDVSNPASAELGRDLLADHA